VLIGCWLGRPRLRLISGICFRAGAGAHAAAGFVLGLAGGFLFPHLGSAAQLARLLVVLMGTQLFCMPLRSISFLNRRNARPIGSLS